MKNHDIIFDFTETEYLSSHIFKTFSFASYIIVFQGDISTQAVSETQFKSISLFLI
jgi:hypothetical protein